MAAPRQFPYGNLSNEPPNNSTVSEAVQGEITQIAQKPKFAQMVGFKFQPRFRYNDMILTNKERLWMFLTVKFEIEKKKLVNLQFVKNSAKPQKRFEIDE